MVNQFRRKEKDFGNAKNPKNSLNNWNVADTEKAKKSDANYSKNTINSANTNWAWRKNASGKAKWKECLSNAKKDTHL